MYFILPSYHVGLKTLLKISFVIKVNKRKSYSKVDLEIGFKLIVSMTRRVCDLEFLARGRRICKLHGIGTKTFEYRAK